MGKCSWCGKEVSNLSEVETLGNTYRVCDSCLEHHNSGKCIACHNPLDGPYSLGGMCLSCRQEMSAQVQQSVIDELNMVDDNIMNNDVGLSTDDYLDWLGLNNKNRYLTPEHRRNVRIDWLKKRLLKMPIWTPELVVEYFDHIEELLDRPDPRLRLFTKMYSGRAMVLPLSAEENGKKYRVAGLDKITDPGESDLSSARPGDAKHKQVVVFNKTYFDNGTVKVIESKTKK